MVPVTVNQYSTIQTLHTDLIVVALFFVVCEYYDLTMDALLENGLSDNRCRYHSSIYQLVVEHLFVSLAITVNTESYCNYKL